MENDIDSRSFSATQIAYAGIRKMIFTTHELKPGQKLVETTIAQHLSVSRTPVREAIHLLQQDGVVERIQNRGAFVKVPAIDDVLMTYEMAAVVDGMICYLLAERVASGENCDEILGNLNDCMEAMEAALGCGDMSSWVQYDRDFHKYLKRNCKNYIINNSFDRVQEMLISEIWGMPMLLSDKETSNTEHRSIVNAIANGDMTAARDLATGHQMRIRNNFREKLK